MKDTNSNYSKILDRWDRPDKKLRLKILQSKISIGVWVYSLSKDSLFLSLLLSSFRGQNEYLRTINKLLFKSRKEFLLSKITMPYE